MTAFDIYIIGTVNNIPELVERHEPAVISGFPMFWENHLEDFVTSAKRRNLRADLLLLY